MKQVLVRRFGGPEVLEFTDNAMIPEPADGQILVKNLYAGVNFVDTLLRHGSVSSELPIVPGMEACGRIMAIKGENENDFSVGDLVVWKGQGSYAEYSTADMDDVVLVPEGISERDAAGAFLPGMTALSLITEAYPVKEGETVLVHASAGGMGQFLCQMLRSIGAFVIGTAGFPQKCETAKDYGAHECINYQEDKNWPERVMSITKGEGVNVVFDSIGKDTWEGSLTAARRKGKVVSFGHSSGSVPPLDIRRLLQKNLSIARVTLSQYITTREELLQTSDRLFQMMLQGELKVNYHEREYMLQDVARAHEDLENRRTSGRVLLKM